MRTVCTALVQRIGGGVQYSILPPDQPEAFLSRLRTGDGFLVPDIHCDHKDVLDGFEIAEALKRTIDHRIKKGKCQPLGPIWSMLREAALASHH